MIAQWLRMHTLCNLSLQSCCHLKVHSMLRSLKKIQVRKKNSHDTFPLAHVKGWCDLKKTLHVSKLLPQLSSCIFFLSVTLCSCLHSHWTYPCALRTQSKPEFHYNTMDSLYTLESLHRQELSNELHQLDFPDNWILSQDTKHELTEIVQLHKRATNLLQEYL